METYEIIHGNVTTAEIYLVHRPVGLWPLYVDLLTMDIDLGKPFA